MQKKIGKYTQDILDETERLDIWKTKGQLVKAKNYISDLLSKVYEHGVDDGISKYKEWLLGTFGFEGKELNWLNNDAVHAKSHTMGWCTICNKANGQLSEDGICKDCV
jgi:hypothetical protein